MIIHENSKDIIIPGIDDTWHVIETRIYKGKKIFRIQREEEGRLIDKLWVDEVGKPVKMRIRSECNQIVKNSC